MKITVIHSPQEKCGVREYGMQLDRSFRAQGVEIEEHTLANMQAGFDSAPSGGVVLVHFEAGLVYPAQLGGFARSARGRGVKVVFCCHWYDYDHMREHYWNAVDRFVLHRDGYGNLMPGSVVIPLGCPVYEPNAGRTALRAKLGLPAKATVMTTIGFLARWKRLPEVALAMLNSIANHPDLFIHFHTPWPYYNEDAKQDEPIIRDIIEHHEHGKRLKFSTEFLPEKDALDVAFASDLGFVFHPFHTHSVSAATKQFVSARRPLVVTNSSHANDLRGNVGIHRVDTFDVWAFARAVVEIALDKTRLEVLQQGMVEEYKRLNMNEVARQYIELFKEVAA